MPGFPVVVFSCVMHMKKWCAFEKRIFSTRLGIYFLFFVLHVRVLSKDNYTPDEFYIYLLDLCVYDYTVSNMSISIYQSICTWVLYIFSFFFFKYYLAPAYCHIDWKTNIGAMQGKSKRARVYLCLLRVRVQQHHKGLRSCKKLPFLFEFYFERILRTRARYFACAFYIEFRYVIIMHAYLLYKYVVNTWDRNLECVFQNLNFSE